LDLKRLLTVSLALKEKVQRSIPLKMQLMNEWGVSLSSLDLESSPVVSVQFHSGGDAVAEDATHFLDSNVQADRGNAFRWNEVD
jgi:hypothetical protein